MNEYYIIGVVVFGIYGILPCLDSIIRTTEFNMNKEGDK